MATEPRKLKVTSLAWLALIFVVGLAACTSDSTPEADPGTETTPAEPPNVTTTIALEGRPSDLDGGLVVFLNSAQAGETADITFELYDEDDRSLVANERVTAARGDVVTFQSWEIHIESVGSTEILYWAINPDGQKFGGEPRE